MSATHFQHGLRAAWEVISYTNKYIDSNAPWTLAKEGDEARLCSVLWHAVAAIRVVAAMISPIMPASAQKIAAQLGLAEDWTSAPYAELLDMRGLPDELDTRLGLPLFPRIEDDAKVAIREKVAKRIAGGAETAPQEDEKEQISFQEFQKMDLRAARVLAAERIPKSKNLLKLTVSLGGGNPNRRGGAGETLRARGVGGPQGDTGGQPRAREAHGRGVAGGWYSPPRMARNSCSWTWMKRCRRARRFARGQTPLAGGLEFMQ